MFPFFFRFDIFILSFASFPRYFIYLHCWHFFLVLFFKWNIKKHKKKIVVLFLEEKKINFCVCTFLKYVIQAIWMYSLCVNLSYFFFADTDAAALKNISICIAFALWAMYKNVPKFINSILAHVWNHNKCANQMDV